MRILTKTLLAAFAIIAVALPSAAGATGIFSHNSVPFQSFNDRLIVTTLDSPLFFDGTAFVNRFGVRFIADPPIGARIVDRFGNNFIVAQNSFAAPFTRITTPFNSAVIPSNRGLLSASAFSVPARNFSFSANRVLVPFNAATTPVSNFGTLFSAPLSSINSSQIAIIGR